MVFIITTFFLLYSILIIYYRKSWQSIPDYEVTKPATGIKISVVIPARNEEHIIGKLLAALEKQEYPQEFLETIVVDDHSTDNTAEIVKQFAGVKLLTLQAGNINSFKKKAIEAGIAAATGELIVTTDADCIPPNKWLHTIASFKEENKSAFIVAPVSFNHSRSLLSIFQTLDFMVLQGITGASVHRNIHSMCNGANLAYEKKAFYAVNGFSGIDHIASGDDMLLMHKIWKQYPSRVHYLKSKDAIVTTTPMNTWPAFFNQRIRWASKTGRYDDKRILLVLILVYLFNFSFLVLLIASFWDINYAIWLLGLWVGKTVIEFLFVYQIAAFFGKSNLLNNFFFFQPLHITYTILSGLLSQFGKYEWKGRKVR